MILRIENLQEACKDILAAVDSNELSTVTETLELVTKENFLFINSNVRYNRRRKISVDMSLFMFERRAINECLKRY